MAYRRTARLSSSSPATSVASPPAARSSSVKPRDRATSASPIPPGPRARNAASSFTAALSPRAMASGTAICSSVVHWLSLSAAGGSAQSRLTSSS